MNEISAGFSADDFAAAAQWVANSTRIKTSTELITKTLAGLHGIASKATAPLLIPDLLPGSGLELLHIPPSVSNAPALVHQEFNVDVASLADIGRAVRAAFIAGETDMLRIEADDGAELYVFAAEVRGVVLAAAGVRLVELDS